MTYYFSLVPFEDSKNGVNLGCTYAYAHRDKWVQGPADVSDFLAAGYVKGIDHVRYNGKAYSILRSYVDLDEDFVVIVCTESVTGCDIP